MDYSNMRGIVVHPVRRFGSNDIRATVLIPSMQAYEQMGLKGTDLVVLKDLVGIDTTNIHDVNNVMWKALGERDQALREREAATIALSEREKDIDQYKKNLEIADETAEKYRESNEKLYEQVEILQRKNGILAAQVKELAADKPSLIRLIINLFTR